VNKITKPLLIITLFPLFIIFIISILNINKKTNLQFLIWKTPEFSLAYYIILGGFGGFGLSAISISSFNYRQYNMTRKVKTLHEENNNEFINSSNSVPTSVDNKVNTNNSTKYIERDIYDPQPTLSVPFKIVNNSEFSNDRTQKLRNKTLEINNIKNSNVIEDNDDWNSIPYNEW
tara:strand:+ start:121 stop:645 length:525 start_codon:yes stop_codon:yes gene_type:complete